MIKITTFYREYMNKNQSLKLLLKFFHYSSGSTSRGIFMSNSSTRKFRQNSKFNL